VVAVAVEPNDLRHLLLTHAGDSLAFRSTLRG
jgi:hypothetical protein